MSIKTKLSPLVLFLSITACDQATVGTSGQDKKKSNKLCLSLIGGTKTQAYPATAIIAYAFGTTKFYTCSATFVGHNTMLTAGHCLEKSNPASVRYLGNTELKITDLRERYNKGVAALKVIHHGDAYLSSTMDFNNEAIRSKDFAIVIFPDNTAPAVFPVATQKPAVGSTIRIVSYGNTVFGNTTSEDKYQWTGTNTLESLATRGTSMLAMSAAPNTTSTGDVLATFGDSGGGMYFNDEIIGVASVVGSLSSTLAFNLYTDISTSVNRDLITNAKTQGAVIGPLSVVKAPEDKPPVVAPVVTPPADEPADATSVSSEDGELSIIAPSDELMIDPDVVSRKVKKEAEPEEAEEECEEEE